MDAIYEQKYLISMKKILFRKLLNDLITFFLIALLTSSLIIWVFQAVNYLDIMIEDGRDYVVYIYYSLLNFPKILSKLFPFVLFFSLFYVITKYENNNELIIFWNFGVHKIKFINFILIVSLILMIFQIFLSSFVVPKSTSMARNFVKTSNISMFENFIKPQKFNDTIKGLTIYIENKDNDGKMKNLYIKKENDNGFQITYAKKGEFKDIGDMPVLILYDGETINGTLSGITNFTFSKSDFALNNLTTNTITATKTQEISSIDLYNCLHSIYVSKSKIPYKNIENCKPKNSKNIFKELYKRLIIPFYIPILILIVFFLILSSKENPSYNKYKIFILLTGFFFIIFSETTIRLINDVIINNLLITLIPYIIFLILYFLLLKKLSFNYYSK